MSNNEPKLNFLMLQDTLRQIAETSASVSQLIPKISLSQLDSLKQALSEISSISIRADAFLSGWDSVIREISDTSRLVSQISAESLQGYRDSLLSVQDALVCAIAAARPYMSPVQIEEAESIVPDIFEPAPPEKPKKSAPKISISTLLALLSLLVTIIFGIISTLPDKQLEQIAEQNAVLIEQNEDLYSLEEEKLAVLRQLLETAQDVSDVLDALDQDPDSVADVPEELPLSAYDLAEVVDDLDKPAEPEDKPADNGRLDNAQNTEK